MLVSLSLALAATLSGCVTTFAYSDLEREAEDSDVLPATLQDDSADWLVSDSIRLVGDDAGLRFYLARATDGGICVLIYRDTPEWLAGCGNGVTVDGAGVSARVVPDSTELEAGWTMVGENVQVKGLPD